MSNFAFQITQDDVENVLTSHHVPFDDERIDDIMALIDDDQIAGAALKADTSGLDDDEAILMKQTEVAYDEIARQLFQAEIISAEQVQRFGNPAILQA